MSDAKACFGCGNDTEVEPVVECEECALEQVEHARRLSAALAASQARVAELEAWQLEIAEGMGFVNRAEGQDGYEVAPAATVLASWNEAQEMVANGYADAVGERDAEIEAESAAKDAVINALRERIQWELVNLSADHSWCRLCRTERTGYRGSYAEHPHAPDCVLSLSAVKLAADAQARRDEAVAEVTVLAMISASAAYGAEEGMADYAADVAQHAARRLGVAASTTRLPSRDHPSDLKAVIRAALAKVKP